MFLLQHTCRNSKGDYFRTEAATPVATLESVLPAQEELRMEATVVVLEPEASRRRRQWRTRMAIDYLPLYRDTQLGRVTHLCPRGPIANGVGSGWCEERDVGRAGLRRVEGADIRVEGADIRRAGPTWAAGQELVVGRQRYADSGHVNVRDNGIF